MTVGELKELLKDVPDDYVIGYTKIDRQYEKWGGIKINTDIKKLDVDLNCNLKSKILSMFQMDENK